MAMLKSKSYRSGSRGGRKGSRRSAPAWGPRGLEEYLVNGKRRIAAEGITATETMISDMDRYLTDGHGREGRVIAYAHSDYILSPSPSGWAEEMLDTKREWHKTGGRQMYQFVVSPDPEDHVSPEECRDLAAAWARECFPEGQWVVEVHDDNENHITHAHVVLNSVLPESGAMVHRSKSDVAREAKVLQRLCVEHGLTAMADARRTRAARAAEANQRVIIGPAEREMRRRGVPSWQASMRDAIDRAASASSSWDQFVGALDAEGIDATVSRRGLTYVMRDWQGDGARRWQSSRMGSDYTREGIAARLDIPVGSLPRPHAPRPAWRPYAPATVPQWVRHDFRERTEEPTVGRPTTLAEAIARASRHSASTRRVKGLAQAMATVSTEGIASTPELDARLAEVAGELHAIEARMETVRTGVEKARRIHEDATRLQEAREALTALPVGFWSPATRSRRAELTATVEELEASCASRLASAREWLVTAGANLDDPAECAERLVEGFSVMARDGQRRHADVSARLDALTGAQRAIDRALRVSPNRASRQVTTGRDPLPSAATLAQSGSARRVQAILDQISEQMSKTPQVSAAKVADENARRAEESAGRREAAECEQAAARETRDQRANLSQSAHQTPLLSRGSQAPQPWRQTRRMPQ